MNIREKRTEIYLKELGFLVHTVSKPSRIGMNHDIFGLWDHIAFAQRELDFNGRKYPMGSLLLVQTKSRPIYGKDITPFYDFVAPEHSKYLFVHRKETNGRYTLIIKELDRDGST